MLPNPQKELISVIFSLTSTVLEESLSKGASVIVAYHPTIFQGLKSITLSNPLQKSLLQCAAQGISVYCPHTALDSVWGGINDWLAEGLMAGKEDGQIRSLVGDKLNATSGESEGGEGRLVTLSNAIGMDVLERRVKAHLQLCQSLFISSFVCPAPHVNYFVHLLFKISSVVQVGYPQGQSRSLPVRTIAICAGSGGSMLGGQDADVYLTGEMQHVRILSSLLLQISSKL